jgi:hypothetical protein
MANGLGVSVPSISKTTACSGFSGAFSILEGPNVQPVLSISSSTNICSRTTTIIIGSFLISAISVVILFFHLNIGMMKPPWKALLSFKK